MTVAQRAAVVDELLKSSLPLLARDLRVYHHALAMGTQKYTTIDGPVLAIFAHPPETPPAMAVDSASRARADSLAHANLAPHIDNYARGIPPARVVRIPHANHYVFRSHEAEVLREIRAFIAKLP